MLTSNSFKNGICRIAVFCLLAAAFCSDGAAQCGGVFFKRPKTTTLPSRGYFKYAEDINGDGKLDLIGQDLNASDNFSRRVIIVPGDGTGGFTAPIYLTVPSGFQFTGFSVGDIDGDGLKDVLVFVMNSVTQFYFKNNGNGSFALPSQLMGNIGGDPPFFQDVNGDNKVDVITTHNVSDLFFGNGDGTFGSGIRLCNGEISVAGDFTGDGKTDFFCGNNLIFNQGNNTYAASLNVINLGVEETPRYAGDFTGDGKIDVLTVTGLKISLLTNLGNNSFSRTDFNTGNSTGEVFTGDFNGDGTPDFVNRRSSVAQMTVYANNGSGVFTQQDYNYRIYGGFVGDFTSDGKADFAGYSTNQVGFGAPRPTIFDNAVVSVEKNVCDRPGQTKIVDFNRDGQTDYLFWQASTGNWSYRTSPGTVVSTGTFQWGSGALGDIPIVGDFDRDGITDAAVFRPASGTWFIRRSSNLSMLAIQFGADGDKPVPADYDGDGMSDIAVFRPSDGTWYILFMGPQNYTAGQFGTSGDKPVPEDYDGDGKADIAVYRPSAGTWYYIRSSDSVFVAFPWGISTDKPVPADYDGDGKADLAVYRNEESNWYILRSYDSNYGILRFGLFQDFVQPGDYNGDGVFDAGIYRPANGLWFASTNQQANFAVTGGTPVSSVLKVE
jgi:hypothetical protein